jgi:hypothetical protein
MTEFVITIPDKKSSFFLKMMKSISFIKDVKIISNSAIPEFHKEIIDKRLEYAKQNPQAFEDWEGIYKELNESL